MSSVLLILALQSASANPLNPVDYASLGSMNTVADVSIDTDSLQMTGGVFVLGIEVVDSGNSIAVFTFDSINIQHNLTVTGSRPLALLSHGDLTFDGLLRANASNHGDLSTELLGGSGGGGVLGSSDGGGGGAIELGALGLLSLQSSARIEVNGSAGQSNTPYGAGGGSGGGVC